jgi:hypothetical protein
MPEYHLLSFAPFRLDVRNAQLRRGQEVIRLTTKPWPCCPTWPNTVASW